jgi:essential nuclear protein 1
MPKALTPARPSTADRRHIPLADDILAAGHLRSKSGKRKSRSDEGDADHYLDARASRRILQIGQELAEEDAAESRAAAASGAKINPAFDFESRFTAAENCSDDDDGKYGDDQWGNDDEEVEEAVWWFLHTL